MQRTIVLLAMLFSLLLQGMALTVPRSTVSIQSDIEHAAMHFNGEAHHHHDDGSYHPDDSRASKLHVLSDNMTVTIVLVLASPQQFPLSVFAKPDGFHGVTVPDPFLDGLLRPPRPHA